MPVLRSQRIDRRGPEVPRHDASSLRELPTSLSRAPHAGCRARGLLPIRLPARVHHRGSGRCHAPLLDERILSRHREGLLAIPSRSGILGREAGSCSFRFWLLLGLRQLATSATGLPSGIVRNFGRPRGICKGKARAQCDLQPKPGCRPIRCVLLSPRSGTCAVGQRGRALRVSGVEARGPVRSVHSKRIGVASSAQSRRLAPTLGARASELPRRGLLPQAVCEKSAYPSVEPLRSRRARRLGSWPIRRTQSGSRRR